MTYKDIIKDIEHYLDFESAEYDVNLHALKEILHLVKFNENKMAATLLSEADQVENKNLKTHINYTLNTMRDTKEMEREVLHEYFHMMMDPHVSELKSRILIQSTMRREQQREWKKKLNTIMEKASSVVDGNAKKLPPGF